MIEAAHWDPVSMFRTGKRHRLTSEAGKRNERGVDPTICEVAADRVAELLTTYGGGPSRRASRSSAPRPAGADLAADELSARGRRLPIDADDGRANLRAVGAQVPARRH